MKDLFVHKDIAMAEGLPIQPEQTFCAMNPPREARL
jgi:hypothetical protein